MFKSTANSYGFSFTANHLYKGLRCTIGYDFGAYDITLSIEEALKLYNYLGEVYGKRETETSENKGDIEKTIPKPSETGGSNEGNKSGSKAT